MNAIVNFGKFWYDFIIGDDWMIAALVAITLIVIIVLPHHAVLWWLLPIVVILALAGSLWRATR